MAGTTYRDETIKATRNNLGFSNIIQILLNVLSLLCSIVFIGMGIWLATQHDSSCLKVLQWPVIAVGLFLFVFSLLGIVAAFLRIKILLWFYLTVALLIIVALLAIAVFAFIVTSRGSGESVNGRAYDDYFLHDYSKWMQQELRMHWSTIRDCIKGLKECEALDYNGQKSFFKAHLNPLESGCCKPPTACNFSFVNATYWIPTDEPSSDGIADCNTWNNDPSVLCYDCDSCRAAVAENSRRAWTKIALACAVLLVFLILVYSFGCCALRNDKNRFYERRRVVTNSVIPGYVVDRRSADYGSPYYPYMASPYRDL